MLCSGVLMWQELLVACHRRGWCAVIMLAGVVVSVSPESVIVMAVVIVSLGVVSVSLGVVIALAGAVVRV